MGTVPDARGPRRREVIAGCRVDSANDAIMRDIALQLNTAELLAKHPVIYLYVHTFHALGARAPDRLLYEKFLAELKRVKLAKEGHPAKQERGGARGED